MELFCLQMLSWQYQMVSLLEPWQVQVTVALASCPTGPCLPCYYYALPGHVAACSQGSEYAGPLDLTDSSGLRCQFESQTLAA